MSRRTSSTRIYQPLLRRAGLLAAVSLGLAFALVSFLFGFNNDFFSRLLSTFFVFFWLSAVTFLGVVPFVTWATNRLFGKGWAATTAALTRKPRALSPPTTVRKSVRIVPGQNN